MSEKSAAGDFFPINQADRPNCLSFLRSVPRLMPRIPVFDVGNVLIRWDPRHLYRKLFDGEEAMERFLADVCTPSWNEEQDRGRLIGGYVPGVTKSSW